MLFRQIGLPAKGPEPPNTLVSGTRILSASRLFSLTPGTGCHSLLCRDQGDRPCPAVALLALCSRKARPTPSVSRAGHPLSAHGSRYIVYKCVG